MPMAKPMAGVALAAQLRDQPVVTAAGAYGILGARGLRDPLEHGAAVVVEAAHQSRVDLVLDADVAQHGAQRLEVLRATPDRGAR